MFDLVKSPNETISVDMDFSKPTTTVRHVDTRGFYARFIKRAVDVTAIVLMLPVILPIIALCYVLIRRDGGPAFYSQERIGKNGETFICWKLRSMVVDAEARLDEYLAQNPEAKAEWDLNQKLLNDPRITRVGSFIRKMSIDELPQLFCVLKGDMSLVGPRPFMPDQQDLYPGRAYYDLRPGLTGLWQVSDRHESTFASRAGFDNNYAADLSLKGDVSILMRTVGVVLRGTGV
jgi:lipopolysaccharide/colanic/teichoic acid biosynthesis glycosyltransferase